MQKTLAAATVAALIGVAGAANAADVYSRGGSLKDGPIFAPASSWTGFYIGLGVGGGDIDSHVIGTDNAGGRANLDGLGGDGFLGRAQVGYDYQLGSRWLAGIFFDYDLANLTSSFNSTGQLTDVHANLKESLDSRRTPGLSALPEHADLCPRRLLRSSFRPFFGLQQRHVLRLHPRQRRRVPDRRQLVCEGRISLHAI